MFQRRIFYLNADLLRRVALVERLRALGVLLASDYARRHRLWVVELLPARRRPVGATFDSKLERTHFTNANVASTLVNLLDPVADREVGRAALAFGLPNAEMREASKIYAVENCHIFYSIWYSSAVIS